MFLPLLLENRAPHPTAFGGHPLPWRGLKFSKLSCPLPRGEGGERSDPGEGSWPGLRRASLLMKLRLEQRNSQARLPQKLLQDVRGRRHHRSGLCVAEHSLEASTPAKGRSSTQRHGTRGDGERRLGGSRLDAQNIQDGFRIARCDAANGLSQVRTRRAQLQRHLRGEELDARDGCQSRSACVFIFPGHNVRRGGLESSGGNSQGYRRHTHLEMRQDNLHHSFETTAFNSQPLFLFQLNVLEFHRRTGVSCQAQPLKAPFNLETFRALSYEVHIQIDGPGGTHLARRNHIAIRFAGACNKGLAS